MLQIDKFGMAAQWSGPYAIAGRIVWQFADEFGVDPRFQSNSFGSFEDQCHSIEDAMLFHWIGRGRSEIPWPRPGQIDYEICWRLLPSISIARHHLFVDDWSSGFLSEIRLRDLWAGQYVWTEKLYTAVFEQFTKDLYEEIVGLNKNEWRGNFYWICNWIGIQIWNLFRTTTKKCQIFI